MCSWHHRRSSPCLVIKYFLRFRKVSWKLNFHFEEEKGKLDDLFIVSHSHSALIHSRMNFLSRFQVSGCHQEFHKFFLCFRFILSGRENIFSTSRFIFTEFSIQKCFGIEISHQKVYLPLKYIFWRVPFHFHQFITQMSRRPSILVDLWMKVALCAFSLSSKQKSS